MTRSRRGRRCSAASRCWLAARAKGRLPTPSARTRSAPPSSRPAEAGDMAQEKIGVVGAGLMGAEIALVFALAGHEVVLSDRSEELLSAAMERLARVLDRGIP